MNEKPAGRKRRRICSLGFLCAAALAATAGGGEPLLPLLGPASREHLEQALGALGMTLRDLEFAKDVADPHWAPSTARRVLRDPLSLPVLGDELLAAATGGDPAALWPVLAGWLDAKAPPPPTPVPPWNGAWEGLDPELATALNAWVGEAARCLEDLEKAFSAIPAGEREWMTAYALAGLFRAEDDREAFRAFVEAGVSESVLAAVLAQSGALDPEPDALRFLKHLDRLDVDALLAAARRFRSASGALADRARNVAAWPDRQRAWNTPTGTVLIGTPGNDAYAEPAALILDPGGDNRYGGRSAAANGLLGQPLAAVIDLAGNDRYKGAGLAGPGTALFGLLVVLDEGGNDHWQSSFAGQGSGLFGVGWVESRAGDNTYRAGGLAQGAAIGGAGLLLDHAGNDLYEAGFRSQGFAGVRGAGLLLDREGHDAYRAGGREPDHERNPDRFLSLSQGCSIGLRPFAGGGVGALVDLAGNDTYWADVYGQGVGYYYAVGLLLDLAGNDSYHVYQYGQGTGVHLSAGLLFDGGGDDLYTGYILAQGSAHDYAVGLLIDRAGDDTYTADHHAQGRALNNALALLLDEDGNDAYFCRQNDRGQGIGNEGGHRDYGSLALLLDLGGTDFYSCGAGDGARLLRPLYGIVYDVAGEPAAPPREDPGLEKAARSIPPSPRPLEALEPDPAFRPEGLSFDALMRHAARYGDTPLRRARKAAAKEELFRRGPEALRYLVSRFHIRNMWFFLFAQELTEHLDDRTAVAALLEGLDAPQPDIRKFSAYLLGFCDTPEHAGRLLPLLEDEHLAGAATRTLGKWRAREAGPAIAAFLTHENELRRIAAANALRDIGDPRAAEALIAALEDPFFTVRRTAARALEALREKDHT